MMPLLSNGVGGSPADRRVCAVVPRPVRSPGGQGLPKEPGHRVGSIAGQRTKAGLRYLANQRGQKVLSWSPCAMRTAISWPQQRTFIMDGRKTSIQPARKTMRVLPLVEPIAFRLLQCCGSGLHRLEGVEDALSLRLASAEVHPRRHRYCQSKEAQTVKGHQYHHGARWRPGRVRKSTEQLWRGVVHLIVERPPNEDDAPPVHIDPGKPAPRTSMTSLSPMASTASKRCCSAAASAPVPDIDHNRGRRARWHA